MDNNKIEFQKLVYKIVSNSDVMIFKWKNEPDFPIEFVTNNVTSILGYNVNDFLDGIISYREIIYHSDKNRILKEIDEVVNDSSIKYHTFSPFRVIKSNSTTIWVENIVKINRTENGICTGFEGTSTDVSQKVRSEEQLRQSQRLEAIGHLAGGIAHDFNNILTAISGYAELALIDVDDKVGLDEDLNQIRLATERASNLTKQLLTFSRKEQVELKIINVNERILNLEKMMHHLIMEDIHLETDLAHNTPLILSDPGQFEQIIVNLVVNAADAIRTNVDSVEKNILIKTRYIKIDKPKKLINSELHVGEYLSLEVTDTGIGISDDIKKHIFEPFYTTKTKEKGTGLGLATVYGIVSQNGATINIKSNKKIGTIFTIYWPITKKESQEKHKLIDEVIKATNNETILFVEDNDQIRKLHTRHLELLGYNVISACNGVEALQKFQFMQDKIDLLFTDVIMPIMDGYELYRQIKKDKPNLQTLFASGYLDGQLNEEIRDLGKSYFIHKPYGIRETSKKIRYLLDNR